MPQPLCPRSGSHAVNLEEVVFCLHITQVTVSHSSERDFHVCRGVGEAQQKHAAVVEKKRRVLEIAEFLSRTRGFGKLDQLGSL